MLMKNGMLQTKKTHCSYSNHLTALSTRHDQCFSSIPVY